MKQEEFDFYDYGKHKGRLSAEDLKKQIKVIRENYGDEAAEEFLWGIASAAKVFSDMFFENAPLNLKNNFEEGEAVIGEEVKSVTKHHHELSPYEKEYGSLVETEEERKAKLNSHKEKAGRHL